MLFGTHTAVAHELSAPAAADRAAFFDGVTSMLALPPRPPPELRAAAAPPPKVPHDHYAIVPATHASTLWSSLHSAKQRCYAPIFMHVLECSALQ